jgi:hypothetical protein
MNRKAKIQMDGALRSGLLPFEHTPDKSDPQNSTLWSFKPTIPYEEHGTKAGAYIEK